MNDKDVDTALIKIYCKIAPDSLVDFLAQGPSCDFEECKDIFESHKVYIYNTRHDDLSRASYILHCFNF